MPLPGLLLWSRRLAPRQNSGDKQGGTASPKPARPVRGGAPPNPGKAGRHQQQQGDAAGKALTRGQVHRVPLPPVPTTGPQNPLGSDGAAGLPAFAEQGPR
ncbi:hypothetical protein ABPG77_009847 [Micractinium sp. CCAP 211/92]